MAEPEVVRAVGHVPGADIAVVGEQSGDGPDVAVERRLDRCRQPRDQVQLSVRDHVAGGAHEGGAVHDHADAAPSRIPEGGLDRIPLKCLGGARELRFQVDAFNAFNVVNYTARNTTINYTSPTNLTILNAQYNADGTLAANRLLPRNAGFGAATNAEALRNFQAMIRFSF